MQNGAMFGESFVDGFTMAGLLQRLRRPGEAARLLEPPSELHRVPEPALRKMLILPESESEYRKAQTSTLVQTMHGAS